MRSIRCELTRVLTKTGGLTSGLSDEAPNMVQVRIIAGLFSSVDWLFVCGEHHLVWREPPCQLGPSHLRALILIVLR